MDLKEWTVNYVKNKDLLHRKLECHKDFGKRIEFTFKNKVHDYVVQEKLSLDYESKADEVTLVCPATQENIDFMLRNWKGLAEKKNLAVLFVNLKADSKLVIKPYTHSLIADPESLEQGIKTMFEQVSE